MKFIIFLKDHVELFQHLLNKNVGEGKVNRTKIPEL